MALDDVGARFGEVAHEIIAITAPVAHARPRSDVGFIEGPFSRVEGGSSIKSGLRTTMSNRLWLDLQRHSVFADVQRMGSPMRKHSLYRSVLALAATSAIA